MTQEQRDFEDKYHFKIVKPLGNHYKIPIKEYVVTSALFNWDERGSIFAIKALDYTLENKQWITIHIAPEEFDKCIADFEIIRDGKEETKPVILAEELISWEREDEMFYFGLVTSFTRDGDSQWIKIAKKDVKTAPKIGSHNYIFKYTSIYDVGTPSFYKIELPLDLNKELSLKMIESARQDILDGKVAYGINKGAVKV